MIAKVRKFGITAKQEESYYTLTLSENRKYPDKSTPDTHTKNGEDNILIHPHQASRSSTIGNHQFYSRIILRALKNAWKKEQGNSSSL